MEIEELLRGLLDWLIIGLRDVDAWDDYVLAVAENDDIKEMDSPDFTDEQMAAFGFWRITGVEPGEDGEVRSKFDTESESPNDDPDDAVIVSLADWLMTFEKE